VPKTPCPKGVLIDEKEESMEPMTLRTKMCYNDVSNTTITIGFIEYVRHKNKRC
jgi:hypothetical protein